MSQEIDAALERVAERIRFKLKDNRWLETFGADDQQRVERIIAVELSTLRPLLVAAQKNCEFNGAIPSQHKAIAELSQALQDFLKEPSDE